jgi:hypothetical protein
MSLALLLVSEAAPGAEATCLLPSQKPMVVAELFFGRDIAGRAPVSDAEWARFVVDVIARRFPDGFTVQDGDGEWLDPKSHHVVRERTKVLTVAVEPSTPPGPRLQTIMDTYKRQFHQSSVGITTIEGCGAF